MIIVSVPLYLLSNACLSVCSRICQYQFSWLGLLPIFIRSCQVMGMIFFFARGMLLFNIYAIGLQYTDS